MSIIPRILQSERPIRHVVPRLAVFTLLASLAACQSTDRFVQVADDINSTVSGARFDPTQQQRVERKPDPDRDRAVAEIRAKASARSQQSDEFPNVFAAKDSPATELVANEEEARIARSVGPARSSTGQYSASVRELDESADALRRQADTHLSAAEAEILRLQAQQAAEQRKAAEGDADSNTED